MAARASAGILGDVVIDSDTAWPEDDYEVASLRVVGGATLRVGGGSTVDVGALTVESGAVLLLEGKNREALVAGQWRGQGVEILAGEVTVEAGGSISADGQGYVGTAGPGAGASDLRCGGSTAGGGGGHGGAGGAAALGASGGGVYGSPIAPAELGSGGGNNPGCAFISTANAGGGIVRLEVEAALRLDGRISADAAAALPERLGGGAGGSIEVRAGILLGTGTFSANGAAGGSATAGGGGGGRIFVSYEDASSFTGFVLATAQGGEGHVDGAIGTVAFVDQSLPDGHLRVFENLVFDPDSPLAYGAVTVERGATLRIGGGSTVDVDVLTVRDGAVLTLEGKNRDALVEAQWRGEGVAIFAGAVTVEASGAISADGQGYVGTAGPGAGASDLSCGASTAGGGGGHGGAGGAAALGASGGGVYGSPTEPAELGSGGGNNPGCAFISTANAGGGIVRLEVEGVLRLDGRISADAAAALPERLGGGAGGSVNVRTATLTGGGWFSAAGAAGGSATAGGGGGGRIFVSYQDASSFTGFALSTAHGGEGHVDGAIGTLAIVDQSLPDGHLRVFESLVFGADSVLVYETVTVEAGATLRIGGGSTVDAGALTVRDGALLTLGGKNRVEPVEGQWRGEGVAIFAADMTVEAGGWVSADGQGYIGTAGPGAGASDLSCGGSTAGGGGGHGGAGGAAAFGASGGGVYGSPTEPAELGSGGGNNPGCAFISTANAGGGIIRLEVEGVLRLDGRITADAADVLSERLGGGAGGAINVRTATLTGGGWFSADGTAGGSATSGGGGGGRVLVAYEEADSFTGFTQSTARGGAGNQAGQTGTVLFVDASLPGAGLRVFENVVFGPDSLLTYEAITVEDGATLRIGGGSTVEVGVLTVGDGAVLLLEGKNRDAQVDGAWRGTGVQIRAGDVTVQAGGWISADGQGYVGTAGPGAGASDLSCGASTAGGGGGHGGAGGAAAFGASGGGVYGSPAEPAELGSGGGNNPGCAFISTANAGGGAIGIEVAGTLRLDGRITADAAGVLSERLGGGAGGSIDIRATRLIGEGSASCNGAAAGSATAGGGGGGRIAVRYTQAALAGARNSTVLGGSGNVAGQNGTLVLIDELCDGDCDGNGAVSIAELIRAVNIALELAPVGVCPAADSDASDRVEITDLIRAVNRALSGC